MRSAGLVVDMPAFAKAAIDGDDLLAVWGLAWSREPHRCWLFFHVENYRPGFGFVIRREARKCLRHAVQLGESEVFTPRDTQFPTSEKLCRMVGFSFYAVENGQEVWIWRSSEQ